MDLSSLLPFIIALLGSGSIITVIIQDRITKLRIVQEKLRDDRRKVYIDLLSPFVLIFTKGIDQQEVLKNLLSQEYRKTSFELALLGSDDVVKAYGNLMQYSFRLENQEIDKNMLIKLYATLLLRIRKDLGNKYTQLNEKDMLAYLIKDIDKLEYLLLK
ncbi:MAG: hypothetical protein RBR63_04190 [Methanosarcina vacuolata]|jgi:hypothetical protein|nr:hypothetical protein [Methanosarcina vacuolata]